MTSSHPESMFLNSADLLILAVDDHPINRTLLARQLKELGLLMVLAENGIEALTYWREQHFALIITDCDMPKMDGYALATTIREIEIREGRAHIPIIGWTAKTFPEDIAMCAKVGMSDFLSKPATQAELSQIMVKWLITAETQVAATDLATATTATTTPPSLIASSHMDSVVFDPKVLIDMLGDDPVVHRELIDDFLEVAQQLAEEIYHANEAHDASTLTKVSHKLKSSARIVGALQFSGACEALERAGRNAAWAEISQAHRDFLVALKRMNATMAP